MNKPNAESYDLRILRSLRRVIRAVDKYSCKLDTELGLTTPQLLCLDALAKSSTLLTLSGLAASINLGVSTVNGIIDRLEAKQYLVRQRSTVDRRQVFLVLTAAGRGIVEAAPSLLQDRFSASLGKLSPTKQKTITEVLELVVKLMEVDDADTSPHLFVDDEEIDTKIMDPQRKE